MKSVIASLVAVAGMSVAASAVVNTSMSMQVSLDGNLFSDHVDLVQGAGTQLVQVRVSVTYTGPASENRDVTIVDDPGDPDNGIPPTTHVESHQFTPRGLSSLVFQPTVSNWSSADTLSAFANGGAGSNTSSPSGVVTNSSGQYGRIRPWGRTALTGLTGHTASGGQPAGGWLRIAQPQTTNWMGVGSGPNNVSGGSGVNIAQLASIGRVSSDPAFNTTMSSVAIFRFGVTVSLSTLRTLTIDAPAAGMGNLADPNNPNSDREVYWWAVDRANFPTLATTNPQNQVQEGTGSFRGTASVITGAINIVPTPASLALLGLGGLMVARRRR